MPLMKMFGASLFQVAEPYIPFEARANKTRPKGRFWAFLLNNGA